MSKKYNTCGKTEFENEISVLKIPQQEFDSYEEVNKLINYITRSKANKKISDDLISYGARGLMTQQGISDVIKQWKQVQRSYKYPGCGENKHYFGRHCYHEIYCLSEDVSKRIGKNHIKKLAYKLSEVYWKQGHQVVYGIHSPDRYRERLHIHFVINTVCLYTGKKWHDWYGGKTEKRKQELDMITAEFLRTLY